MATIKPIATFANAQEIKKSMKLAFGSTKDLVAAGFEGYKGKDDDHITNKKGFPYRLMDYSWGSTRDYNLVLIFLAMYNYALSKTKSESTSDEAMSKNHIILKTHLTQPKNIFKSLIHVKAKVKGTPGNEKYAVKHAKFTDRLEHESAIIDINELEKVATTFRGIISTVVDCIFSGDTFATKTGKDEKETKKLNNFMEGLKKKEDIKNRIVKEVAKRLSKVTKWVKNGPYVAGAFLFVLKNCFGADLSKYVAEDTLKYVKMSTSGTTGSTEELVDEFAEEPVEESDEKSVEEPAEEPVEESDAKSRVVPAEEPVDVSGGEAKPAVSAAPTASPPPSGEADVGLTTGVKTKPAASKKKLYSENFECGKGKSVKVSVDEQSLLKSLLGTTRFSDAVKSLGEKRDVSGILIASESVYTHDEKRHSRVIPPALESQGFEFTDESKELIYNYVELRDETETLTIYYPLGPGGVGAVKQYLVPFLEQQSELPQG